MTSSTRARAAIEQARAGLIERDVLVELIVLAAVAREHVLVIGPPGTAKSEAARRAARAFEARYFEYLLGRFTEPSEIFGPIDLRKLREGVVETETAGMLPEAEIAFLDEVFLGSTAILNTLLSLLNERTFRRGRTASRVPLRVCIAASNAVPDDPELAAFADRFLVRVFVDPVPDARLEELLEGGERLARELERAEPVARLADLDALADLSLRCELSGVRDALAHAVRLLRKAGITLSDRRVVKAQRLIAGAAALDGRDRASPADLWPLIYVLPSSEAQDIGRTVLRDRLGEAASTSLGAAALDASGSLAARSARLLEAARGLLEVPREGDLEAWQLRIEGVLRDLDATLAPEDVPPELGAVRAELIARLHEPETET